MQKRHSSLEFFLSGFPFAGIDNSQESKDRVVTIFILHYHFCQAHKHLFIYLQFYIWDDYLLLLIVVHVITTLLLDNIIQTLEIRILVSLF